MKKTIISISIIIFVFIITTIIVSLSIINGDDYLKKFSIISVNNISTKYSIKFEKVKAAKYYDLIIYDSNNLIFYKERINDNNLTLDLNNIVYNEKYKLVIYAYDKLNNSIIVNNPYFFTYNEPTFSKDNLLLLSQDEDYTLLIDGDLSKKDYYISINDGDYVIKKDKLINNEYIISKDLYKGLEQVLTINIYDNDNIINTLDLYSNISPIKDLKIVSPSEEEISLEDINLTFEGGDNATEYLLQIYNDDKLLKETSINNKSLLISSEFFKKSNKYTIKINALYDNYEEYSKMDSISFKISAKETLKPSYININPNYVKSGTFIELLNPNDYGKIYYTINGEDPTDKSTEYTDKIEVKENMTIKTIIKDKNYNDSIISEYKINIADKEKYKVYISTMDSMELQDISNDIEKQLKKCNIEIYHNDVSNTINSWLVDAKDKNSDLYLSIHSNSTSGVETWINNKNSLSYSIANIINSSLINNLNIEKKKIKYSGNSLEELNSNLVPLNLLINLGNSNNESDEKWLEENRDLIAKTISNAILKYFGLSN